MTISKNTVLLYTLGMLADDRRRAVEAAKADPVVRHWFRQLDPDAPEVPEPLRRMADEVVAQFDVIHKNAALFRATESHEDWRPMPAGTGPFALADHGGVHYHLTDLAKADAGPTALPTHGVYVADGELVIQYTEADVPFGVVRVTATAKGVAVATRVVLMAFNDKRTWRLRLRTFATGRTPAADAYYVQPATEGLLAWFDQTTIGDMLRDLDEPTNELRPRLTALLELLGSPTHGQRPTEGGERP